MFIHENTFENIVCEKAPFCPGEIRWNNHNQMKQQKTRENMKYATYDVTMPGRIRLDEAHLVVIMMPPLSLYNWRIMRNNNAVLFIVRLNKLLTNQPSCR